MNQLPPILGADFVALDVVRHSEPHLQHAVLNSVNARIEEAKAQLEAYKQRFEGLG